MQPLAGKTVMSRPALRACPGLENHSRIIGALFTQLATHEHLSITRKIKGDVSKAKNRATI